MNNRVSEYFKQHNFDLQPVFTGEDTSTVQKAAMVLGVEDGQIAKSLALNTPDGVIVLVAMGTARLDNKKYKAQFGCKAKMLTFEETLEKTGYPARGVCPFALPDGVKVYLDETLKKYEYMYPAAGTRDSAVKTMVEKLDIYTGGQWVDVCSNTEV